jgi:hypothetical protein
LAQKLHLYAKVPLSEAETNLASDLGDLVQLLQTLVEHGVSLGALVGDIEALVSLTRGGGGSKDSVPAGSVREALNTINTAPRFEVVKAALVATELGKTLLSGCSVLLQLGAKDNAAAIKLTRALEILQEGSMPKATAAAGQEEGDMDASVSNFEMVADMAVAEIMTESFELFDEALALLSPSRLDDMKPRVRKYLDLLFENLRFLDECLCVFVRALLPDAFNEAVSAGGEKEEIYGQKVQGQGCKPDATLAADSC